MEKEDLEILIRHIRYLKMSISIILKMPRQKVIYQDSAIKTYTERRLEEVFENANDFIAKISLIVGSDG